MIKFYSLKIFSLFTLILFFSLNISAQNTHWDYETSSDGSTPVARHENAFTACDGKLYVVGGRFSRAVSIYDPQTNKWTNGATPPIPLHHFQSVCYNNKIYVIAAFTGNFPSETPVTNIYIYDIATNTWSVGDAIPQARQRGSAGVVMYNNKFYITCGIVDGHNGGYVNWFDEYDPANHTWTALTDAPHARDHFHAVISGSKIYLTAGRNTSYSTNQLNSLTIPEVDVYDFNTGNWSTLAAHIPTERGGASSVLFGNEIFVIGGERWDQTAALSTVESFNIQSETWASQPSLNQGRHGTQTTIYNGQLYIACGSKEKGGNGNTELNSMEVFSEIVILNTRKEEKHFEVYPNPFNAQVQVSSDFSGEIDLEIYNSQSMLIKNQKTQINNYVDLSELLPGVYFLKTTDNKTGNSQTFRLIKQ